MSTFPRLGSKRQGFALRKAVAVANLQLARFEEKAPVRSTVLDFYGRYEAIRIRPRESSLNHERLDRLSLNRCPFWYDAPAILLLVV